MSGRNPLKTGLVPASCMRSLGERPSGKSVSQSPENGSRPCKFLRRLLEEKAQLVRRRNPLKTGLVPASFFDLERLMPMRRRASQSPENGSRPCKKWTGPA